MPNNRSTSAGSPAQNYELGRADERVDMDVVLARVQVLLELVPTGYDPAELAGLLETIRVHRRTTEMIVEAGKQRGWYPR
jgi:hypothetical protein